MRILQILTELDSMDGTEFTLEDSRMDSSLAHRDSSASTRPPDCSHNLTSEGHNKIGSPEDWRPLSAGSSGSNTNPLRQEGSFASCSSLSEGWSHKGAELFLEGPAWGRKMADGQDQEDRGEEKAEVGGEAHNQHTGVLTNPALELDKTEGREALEAREKVEEGEKTSGGEEVMKEAGIQAPRELKIPVTEVKMTQDRVAQETRERVAKKSVSEGGSNVDDDECYAGGCTQNGDKMGETRAEGQDLGNFSESRDRKRNVVYETHL